MWSKRLTGSAAVSRENNQSHEVECQRGNATDGGELCAVSGGAPGDVGDNALMQFGIIRIWTQGSVCFYDMASGCNSWKYTVSSWVENWQIVNANYHLCALDEDT